MKFERNRVTTNQNGLFSHKDGGYKVWDSRIYLPKITGLQTRGLDIIGLPYDAELTFIRCSTHRSDFLN